VAADYVRRDKEFEGSYAEGEAPWEGRLFPEM